MTRGKWLRTGSIAALLLGLAFTTGTAQAKFSTERPGSILIFPKVVNAAGRDSIIQVTNTSNVVRRVRCFYVNGAPRNPYLPADPLRNPASCQVTDFEITLTRQQPTHWQASVGRAVDSNDSDVQGRGIDPGLVPPVPPGFTGGLVCAEVDDAGAPVAGNALKGEVTIGAAASGDVSKYNGITVEGLNPGADLTLALDNVEYNACPAGLLMNFEGEGGSDAVVDSLGGGSSQVNSNLVLMPCGMDFLTGTSKSVAAQFLVRNEFEEALSGSESLISCWASLNLDANGLESFLVQTMGSDYGFATITPVESGGNGVGLIGVLSTRRADGTTGASGTSASNLLFSGNEAGQCADGSPCAVDGDCASGACTGVTNAPGATILLRGF